MNSARTDWQEVRLGEICEFVKTIALSRSQLQADHGVGCIHYGDIHTKFNDRLDCSTIELPMAESGIVVGVPRLKTGDLVIADASEDMIGVGKGIEILGIPENGVVAGLHTAVLRPQAGLFAKGFLGQLQHMPKFKEQARVLASGLKVYGLSKTSISKISVEIPPLNEQAAIAEALSDADSAIESLDVLIAKKRDVKQATMQQLLTGRTRLPGFTDEWKEVRLGDLGTCLRGVSYKGDSDLSDGDTPTTVRLLRSNNVQNSLIQFNDVQYVNHDCVSDEQFLRRDDIVICMANGSKVLVGKTGLYKDSQDARYTFGAFMGCFRSSSDQAHAIFVRYLFLTKQYQDYISNLLAGSSINNLTPKSIESLLFNVPLLKEQEAIAEVLSAMDDELEALTEQGLKLRMVKDGMMQDLLTGKVRLV